MTEWKIIQRPQRDRTVVVTATLGARVMHVTFKNAAEADAFGNDEAQRRWDFGMMKWRTGR